MFQEWKAASLGGKFFSSEDRLPRFILFPIFQSRGKIFTDFLQDHRLLHQPRFVLETVVLGRYSKKKISPRWCKFSSLERNVLMFQVLKFAPPSENFSSEDFYHSTSECECSISALLLLLLLWLRFAEHEMYAFTKLYIYEA